MTVEAPPLSRHKRALPSRRAVVAGFACVAIAPAGGLAQEKAPSSADDERFMRIALRRAQAGDYPFGAVIVRDGEVIARGRNLSRTNGDPTAHGEMIAIRRALNNQGPKALHGATIYTTGEPCAMCMGAIVWCHFGRVVYGASVEQLATKVDQIMVSSADIAAKGPFGPIAMTGGVLADEAMSVFAK